MATCIHLPICQSLAICPGIVSSQAVLVAWPADCRFGGLSRGRKAKGGDICWKSLYGLQDHSCTDLQLLSSSDRIRIYQWEACQDSESIWSQRSGTSVKKHDWIGWQHLQSVPWSSFSQPISALTQMASRCLQLHTFCSTFKNAQRNRSRLKSKLCQCLKTVHTVMRFVPFACASCQSAIHGCCTVGMYSTAGVCINCTITGGIWQAQFIVRCVEQLFRPWSWLQVKTVTKEPKVSYHFEICTQI